MTTGNITCMIADDDEIDRLTTLSFTKQHPFLTILGVFESAIQLLDAAAKTPPDTLLLDIDMPEMNGLQLRKKLLEIPACIFITSFPDYAVESFENEALDFLVKPLNAERFAKAMERLKEYQSIRKKAALLDNVLGSDTIYIKEGHKQIKIQLHEVVYLEALKDYTSIVTTEKKYCVLSALGNLLKEKSFQSFLRIHRSYAVQKNYINKITATGIMVNNTTLPVGRSYKDALTNLNTRPL
ncbi:MAG: response regulator transcription factor [Ferruginibacter sp.]|nr:response regulator transcription factor [Chitinophagaceae bacterium]